MTRSAHPLRTWRKAHGVTLTTLAEKLGVRPSHLSGIENGKNPSMALAARIREATDGEIRADDLLPREVTE